MPDKRVLRLFGFTEESVTSFRRTAAWAARKTGPMVSAPVTWQAMVGLGRYDIIVAHANVGHLVLDLLYEEASDEDPEVLRLKKILYIPRDSPLYRIWTDGRDLLTDDEKEDIWWAYAYLDIIVETEATPAPQDRGSSRAAVMRTVDTLDEKLLDGLMHIRPHTPLEDVKSLFPKSQRGHLANCAACREAALMRLGQRVLARQALLCPSPHNIEDWAEDPSLVRGTAWETHVSHCRQCRFDFTMACYRKTLSR